MSSYPKSTHRMGERRSRPRKRKAPKPGTGHRKDDIADNESNAPGNPPQTYKIIEFLGVFQTLAQLLVCRKCLSNVQFKEEGIRGFGFKIVVACSCGSAYIDSGPLINTGYEINRRIVFVMRLLGIGREGINIFAGLMDLGTGLSNSAYENIVKYVYDGVKTVFESVCLKAVDEEKKLNEAKGRPGTQFHVSPDSSWRKRGYTSLLGVSTVTGYLSGKVIDLVAKSSLCKTCVLWKKKEGTDEYVEWYENHEEECLVNLVSGSKMAVDSMKEMFSDCVEKYGVQYVNYIGDGESETYKAVSAMNPYGNECPVRNGECVDHLEKRLESRLQKLAKDKKLGGRGMLTDVLIKKITRCYGLAIRRNVDSVQGMKKAIFGCLDHLTSTDASPKHGNCQLGADSWCNWRQAEASGRLSSYNHPQPLHPSVEKRLIPIFNELSKESILERCLPDSNHLPDSSNSFNSTVWRLAPKDMHCGTKLFRIAAYITASVFNDGCNSVLMMMNELGINVGMHSRNFAVTHDEKRLLRQNRRISGGLKEIRSASRMEVMARNEFNEEEDGLLYGSGIAD